MATRYRRPYADAEEVSILTPRTRPNQQTEDIPIPLQKKKVKGRRYFVKTMFIGGGVSLVLFLYGSPHVQYVKDQWQYGDARISEFLFDVGHGGVSRFLTSYYNGYVSITEYSHNADPGHEHTYSFQAPPNNQPQHVVTLEKRVMQERQNLIVQIEDIPVAYVLYNTGNTFQLAPSELER